MSSNTMNPEEESFDGPEEEKDADDEKKTVFFSRAKDLRAMFEDSLSACFEPASVAVRFDVIFFVLDSRRRFLKKFKSLCVSPLLVCADSLSLSLFLSLSL